MIRIGTGGYNHREWIGSFYPVGMGPARYLARYAEDLEVCELRLSSYRMPREEDAERILGESGGRLFFTALAPVRLVEAIQSAGSADLPSVGAGFLLGEGSPEIKGRDFSLDGPSAPTLNDHARSVNAGAALDRLLVRMREALRPYAKAERFGGLVLPLPASIEATEETLGAIARVHDRLEGLPLLIEPRDASWADAQVLDFFRGVGLGFVLADGPGPEGPSFGPDRGRPRPLPARHLMTFVPLTSETAYVRFQGRDGQVRSARYARGGKGGGAFLPEESRNGHRKPRAQAPGEATTRSVQHDTAWERSGVHPSIRRHGSRRYEQNVQVSRHTESPMKAPAGFPSPPSSYFYSWEELVGWLPTLRALAARAKDLYIVFDNPGRGSALENARMLSRLLGTIQPEGKATGS